MAELLTIISGIVAIIIAILNYALSPNTKRQNQKKAVDEAIYKNDIKALSAMLDSESDRVYNIQDHPQ